MMNSLCHSEIQWIGSFRSTKKYRQVNVVNKEENQSTIALDVGLRRYSYYVFKTFL